MKRILVIDNNVLMLEFMRELLKDEGYTIQTASGGLEALEQVPHFKPDLIFVDLVMPELDGKRLCRLLRRYETAGSSYIVVLSAIAAEDRELDVTAYADAYIAKTPFPQLSRHILTLLSDFEAGKTESYTNTVVGVEDIHTREITRELLHSRHHMDVILTHISDGFIEITANDYTVIFANNAACTFLGLTEEQLISFYFPELFNANCRDQITETLAELTPPFPATLGQEGEIRAGERNLQLKCSRVDYDHYSSFLIVMEDITERIRSEQRMHSSLREKELLLQEVHHRVKNNFQVVSSILNLQMNSSADDAVREVLRISQNRIDAMSLIHENIYRSDNFTRIALHDYLEDLMNRLIQTYAGEQVIRHVEAGNLEVDLVRAIPLGLIVNELVTNSLLHGSSGEGTLELSVSVTTEENASMVLDVRDNGTGFPETGKEEESDSLGLLIVNNLAHQLGGEVLFENDNGAHITLRFPASPSRQAR